ncbi:MAG TPA: outer membrane protein assembly factor BamB [Burkholderiales bacterium]|nr:outer membrane protein assembly factor BamB [Burkholderiales bacterium]
MRRLLLAGAMLLAGCSGTPGPKMAELEDLPSSIPVRTLWHAGIGEAGDAIFFPAVVDGSVYAAAQEGDVARFDAATGRESWRVNVGQTLSGGVGSDGSLVAVGTYQGEVIVLDAAKGAAKWHARVSSEILSPPVVTGDLVIVRAGDGRLFALDAKDGKRRWLYQRSSPPLSVRSPVGMVADRGSLLTGFAGGKLVSIALSNGAVRWEATVSLPRGATELERVTDVVGVPVVAEREVCAVAYQGKIGCFDGGNGSASWSREMSSTAGLSLDARYVFVSDDKGAVQALDRAGGATVWKQDKLFLRRLTAPLPLGDVVAVGDVEGYVHFLSRETGTFVGRIATDGSAIRSSPLRLQQGLLVQTQEGGLYALSLK